MTACEDAAPEDSGALTDALSQSPPSRADVVRRAARLVREPGYPPPEVIRMISRLLAARMHPKS